MMTALHAQELPAEDLHNLVLQGCERKQFEMVPGLASLLALPGVQDTSTQQLLEELEAVVTATATTYAQSVHDGSPAELDDVVDQWLPVLDAYNR
jgi:hypothetical protein